MDNLIGDRGSTCKGLMKPIGKIYKKDGEEVLIHKCITCGTERKNRVAGDDSIDLIEKLLELDTKKYL